MGSLNKRPRLSLALVDRHDISRTIGGPVMTMRLKRVPSKLTATHIAELCNDGLASSWMCFDHEILITRIMGI